MAELNNENGTKIHGVALVAISPDAKRAFVRAIRSGKSFEEATAVGLGVLQKHLDKMKGTK